ncbi:MAG: sulfur oxidation c-type cytochrome SoxX [Pseudomonadota bacterium]|jgi:sulfur-oxidizing protein SoxX
MNGKLIILGLGALALAGCATGMSEAESRQKALAMMKRDFQSRGIAGIDRLNEDEVQKACNEYHNNPPKEVAERLQTAQMAAIKFPADGQLLGDWKEGEKLAQSGRGMTWSDSPGSPNGGNCYNCHQLSPKELSYGTIGPSLYRYGKIRGNSPEIQRYTYGRIYNAKAYSLCSNMPRFGHVGALTEQQIKHLVALLLDPQSPVNH